MAAFDIIGLTLIAIFAIVALANAIHSCVTGRYTWHWYYNGVLGLPFPDSRTPEKSIAIEISSSASNSASSNLAAQTHPQNTKKKEKCSKFRTQNSKRPIKFKRVARMA